MDEYASERDQGDPIRVLHVDDPAVTESTRERIDQESDRLCVTSTNDPIDARDRLAAGEFDCIVSAYQLPSEDGVEFLQRVREDYPELPFFLFAGNGSEAVASDAISAGVTDYLRRDGTSEQYDRLAERIEEAVERSRAERRAATTQRRLRELSETTNDVLFTVTPDWSEFRFVNSAYEELLGRPRDALLDDPLDFMESVHPDDRDLAAAAMEQAADGEAVEVEFRVVPEPDVHRRVWVQAEPVYDDSGDPAQIVGLGRDITERKRKERQLQRQKEKIKALHDVALDIDGCETADAVYELFVDAAESILDFDIAIVDEAVGDVLVPKAVASDVSAEQYYNETPVDADDNLAARAFRSGDSSVVTDLRTHDVAPADPEFRSALTVPIDDDGVFQAVAETTAAFDETDLELVELLVSHTSSALARIRREQALQRQNEQLDEFASVVSHDLRNPLNVAAGELELARREHDSEPLTEVARAHDRMETLLDDLLTLAREGERVQEMEPVELSSVVERSWGSVQTADATLVTETTLRIRADESRLKQLLENLFTNAVEHGGATVTVTVGDLDDESGFYVGDDGAGISSPDQDRVFETGFSNAADGTGLGLSIVEEIAEAHGWSIRFTDCDSGGARFEVTGVETDVA